MPPSEQTKINNAQAQYESILQNINSVNKRLEELISEKQKVEVAYADLCLVFLDKRNELERIKIETESLKEEIKAKSIISLDYDKTIENQSSKIDNLIQEYHQKEIETQEAISQMNFIIEDLIIKEETIENAIIIKSSELSSLENSHKETKKKQAKEKKTLNDDVDRLLLQKEKVIKDIAEKLKELLKVESIISEEKTKIGKSEVSILKQQEELQKEKEQLEIVKGRMVNTYKQMFPDRNLKI